MPQPLRWSLVIERFELPATFRGELRYEDDERDLISVSCDAEVEDALQLYGNSRTLKMFISARDSPVAALPAGALSKVSEDDYDDGCLFVLYRNKQGTLSYTYPGTDMEAAATAAPASVSSASGDFELVEIDSRPASVCASAARKPAKKHTLYLGRNISDGSKVDDQMWRTFQRDTVNRLTTCSTTLDAEGCWYREIEETKIISVIVEDGSLDAAEQYDGLQRVGEEWERRFRQEAVYLETTQVYVSVL